MVLYKNHRCMDITSTLKILSAFFVLLNILIKIRNIENPASCKVVQLNVRLSHGFELYL